MLKISYEKKILKSNRGGKEKQAYITYREANIRITSENLSEKDISEKIMEQHLYSTKRARAGRVCETLPT